MFRVLHYKDGYNIADQPKFSLKGEEYLNQRLAKQMTPSWNAVPVRYVLSGWFVLQQQCSLVVTETVSGPLGKFASLDLP